MGSCDGISDNDVRQLKAVLAARINGEFILLLDSTAETQWKGDITKSGVIVFFCIIILIFNCETHEYA